MSEGYPGGENRLSVTEDEAIADPKLRRQYKDERITRIKAGEPAWILRNFDGSSDMDPGIVIDYYAAGRLRGYIEGDDLVGYQVYAEKDEEEETDPAYLDSNPSRMNHLNTDPVETRFEAEKMLSDYVQEALLR